MPYKSQAQRGKFHAMESRGEISPEIVEEFDKASKGMKLPKKVAKGYAGGGDQPDDDDDDDSTTQPATPATPAANAVDIRAQLADYLKKQGANADAMSQLADVYGDQVGKPDMRGTAMKLLEGMTDHLYGTNFAKTVGAPPSDAEQTEAKMAALGQVGKAQQPITTDLLREYGSDNGAAARAQANYYRGLTSQNAQASRELKQQQDSTNRMHDDMFFKRGTNPQVSQSLAKLQRATSAIALMDKIPEGGPIPGEMSNIASAVAGLATNGNMVTNEKLKEILPSNVDLTTAGITQWLTSEPQGADQQKFLQRFRREIDGETRAARNTLSNYQDAQADSYIGRIPDAVHQQMRQAGQRFLDNSYYNPDNPTGYLGGGSGANAAATKAAMTGQPPAPVKPKGAPTPGSQPKPVTNQKTGAKAWLMPDGSLLPRKE
jgi:hypothetical protein